jgi:hypothetical protein
MMAPLRVIRVELLAGLADLLDHDEHLVLLNDPLDLPLDMSRNDDEPVPLVEDWLVCLRVNLDLLDAPRLCALAVQRHRGADLVEARALLDLPVDLANEFLVPRCASSEIHHAADERRLPLLLAAEPLYKQLL